MRMRRLFLPVGFAVISCSALSSWGAGGTTAPGAVDYAIKFERPLAVSQKFSFHLLETNRAVQSVTMPDGTGSKTDSTKRLSLDGEVTVGHVNAQGQEDVLYLTVRKFSRQGTATNQTATDLVPANAVIKIEYQADKVVFSQQPGTLSEDATTALQSVFKPRKANRVTDDQRYGTAEKKKIGASWPVNVKALTQDQSGAQPMDPANVSGTVTLKSVKAVPNLGDIQCAEVESTVTMKNIPVQGLTPKEATMKVVLTKLLPVDVSKPDNSATVNTQMHVAIDQPGQGAGMITTTVDSNITRVTEWRLTN